MTGIKSKVEEIIIELLELPKGSIINNEISDIGINSLAYVRLIVSLESVFEIEMPDEYLSLDAFLTIDELVECIEGLL